AQAAFELVKQKLIEYPILRKFDPTRDTMLYTDASRIGIGAVLKQLQDDGVYLPVGFFSRKLLPCQKEFSITELECLAVIKSLEYFHFMLIKKPFVLVTDHQPLKHVMKTDELNPRLFKWVTRLVQ